jgi:uncharacterized protein (DUF1501 family)
MTPSIPAPVSGSSPFQGPGLSRRAFLELGASGLVMSWFLPSSASAFAATTASVATKSTARNAIFIFLTGAPSQVDTWDLKEGAWTPADFKPTDMGGGLRFPVGLLPKTAERLGDVAIVRSCLMWALVHGLAQTWTQIARNPTGATGGIAPHLGAIAALELAPRRAPTDVLPSFVALNTGTAMIGSGYLPSLYAPFSVQPTSTGLASLTHPDGTARFALRWDELGQVDAALRSGAPLGKDAADVAGFYTQAKTLMDAPDVNALFSFTDDESTRYGGTSFGNSCLVAKKLLAGRRGARFVQVTLNGWDHHSNIYGTAGNSLYSQSAVLDPALASLLADLKAAPGESGGTLLDETLVLVAGEFGRTVGALNGQGGRDHFLRTSVVLAGGGVKGGRVLGATDATGANLKEAGWSANRDVRPEDLACTLYSALGIDWTTVRHDDPLGRGFEYVPYAKDGTYKPIDELF